MSDPGTKKRRRGTASDSERENYERARGAFTSGQASEDNAFRPFSKDYSMANPFEGRRINYFAVGWLALCILIEFLLWRYHHSAARYFPPTSYTSVF